MHIAVVTTWDNVFEELAQVTWRSKQAYCAKHGYDAVRGEMVPDKHPAWSKIPACLEAMQYHDLVVWIDADAWVTGDADVVNLLGNKDLALCLDMNGVNSGILLLRACDWSRGFLQRTWEQHDRFANHPWREQEAMKAVMQQDLSDMDHIRFLPQRSMNSYPIDVCGDWHEGLWEPGDFILHMPGLPNHTRFEVLKRYGLV